MVVDQNHQSQIDTEPELLVLCICFFKLTFKCCIMKRLYCNYAESLSHGFGIHNLF